MVSDALLSKHSLPEHEWVVTPNPEDLVPDSIERERTSEQFKRALGKDPDAIVLTHDDADGLTSAALVAEYVGGRVPIQPVSYHGAYQLEHACEDILDVGIEETPVYVTDLSVDDAASTGGIDRLINDNDCTVEWYDHHQWASVPRQYTEAAGVDLTVDTEECAASLLRRELNADWPAHVDELVDVTKDHDLWIKEDPRSDRLAAYADITAPDLYVYTVLDYGVDLPSDAAKAVDQHLSQVEWLEEEAIQRAEGHEVANYHVALTYIRGGRSSHIGNYLTEEHAAGYDIAIVCKPHGGVGIYSHSDRETFARCHEVAAELGGGGHPTAAGADVPVECFRDLASYWAHAGATVYEDLLDAVRAVVEGGDD